MRLTILNGPNLNLLGVREPHIYGTTTLAAIEASCRELAGVLGASLAFHQSNHEGALVDLIHAARNEADAIVINPAGFSFTSIAILDALKAFDGPDRRGAHLQHPRARRAAPPLEALHRRQRRDLRAGALRLHRRNAGRCAHAGQAAGQPAGAAPHRAEVICHPGISRAAKYPGSRATRCAREVIDLLGPGYFTS